MTDNPQNVANFLIRMAADPLLVKRYKRSPDAVLKAGGLSTTEIGAVRSGKIENIRGVLPKVAEADNTVIIIVVA